MVVQSSYGDLLEFACFVFVHQKKHGAGISSCKHLLQASWPSVESILTVETIFSIFNPSVSTRRLAQTLPLQCRRRERVIKHKKLNDARDRIASVARIDGTRHTTDANF